MTLYIHIPFCASKCGYCAFSSYTGVDSSVQQAYVQALLLDIASTLGEFRENTSAECVDCHAVQASSQVRENNAVSEKVDSSTAATPSDSAQDSRISKETSATPKRYPLFSKETSANAERYPLFSKEAVLCDEKTSEAVQGVSTQAGFFSKSLLCELTQGRILGVCNRRAHEAIKDLSRKSAQNKRSGASAAQQVSLEKPTPKLASSDSKILELESWLFKACKDNKTRGLLTKQAAEIHDSSPKAESPKPKLDSIYIGGGTPSLLPSSAYTLIFEQIARFCDMQSVQEITIEANPNSLQAQWCRDLASLGVNRISFGVQSFDPRKLVFLEREHSGRDIYHALEIAQVFPHTSIDMMYGTPFDDEATLRADIQKACALDIDHLSAYSLMIEQGARFAHKHKSLAAPSPAQKDSLEKQAHIVREVALGQGFCHYEVSNFARPYKCLHNRAYWAGEEYLGCGVGAVGRVGQVRYERLKDLRAYIANPLASRCERLSLSDLAFEAVFLGLRSEVGVDIAAVSAYINGDRLAILLKEKMCVLRDGRLVASDVFVADEIALWLTR